ncbi:hypothetical protein MOX02_07440 [Methylobacterium oxalidis]|uniref:Uncharacterized protein n=2 Tax=Methylobacterium oxalidis TaxID=944322 RepID=A0A512IYC2_9HYPH|nr:hypothetical protein MOX02_07440 [Methylobacterium oxalidis]GLS66896.1 hypothetical protein GCM10007888_52790 [Methylobacterium oxalidis]
MGRAGTRAGEECMRLILLGALVALAPLSGALIALRPQPASATCSCVCVGGEARSLCTSPVELAPVCARICPQSLGSMNVSPGSIVLPGSVGAGGGGGGPDGLEGGGAAGRGGAGLGGATGLGAATGLGGALR